MWEGNCKMKTIIRLFTIGIICIVVGATMFFIGAFSDLFLIFAGAGIMVGKFK